ncbi:DNA-directed RNA polymerase subunit H [Candidatus Micrarchaeota archaeon]|nr:DNA-directed RNA polymerase subunit H [Candidatus Micrarchaeota archaeon]
MKEFHHVLVPIHELLSKEEAEKVIKKYGDKNLFPKIKKNDPALALFGIKAKPGDIIKITRNDPTGRHVVYRVVRK